MNPTSIPDSISKLPAPLPQVGAVLHLNTSLPEEDLLLGSRHWKLSGSCALVEGGRILTIRHVLDRYGDAAAFFPYCGIFKLKMDTARREPNQKMGDNLMLVELERAPDCVPMRHLKINAGFKSKGYATVCGFGAWHGTPWPDIDGLQQRYRVDLGLNCPKRRGRRIDNLDLVWTSSRHRGLAAGRANSGGPLLWGEEPDTPGEGSFRYVGVSRERKAEADCDQQIASWITRERNCWLNGLVGAENGAPQASSFFCRVVKVAADGQADTAVASFRVPKGARRVSCTLNAAAGLRLQMKIAPDPGDDWLDGIRRDNHATGRFLLRETELNGAQTLAVGVAPYERAPVDADQVAAQICCRFQ